MNNITLTVKHKRYFKNVFSEQLADDVTNEWLISKINFILDYLKNVSYENISCMFNVFSYLF